MSDQPLQTATLRVRMSERDEPLLVARAEGTCVVPLEKQQNRRG